jgi:competence protein ComEA
VAGISLSRQQVLVLGIALVLVLGLVGKRLASVGSAQAPRSAALVASSGRGAASAPVRVVVDVAGSVRRPGLYRLRDGTRVADAIARAGGATRAADLTALNLAAPLVDGQQVLVPRRLTVGGGAGAGAALAAPKVSLASATVDQLDELPGVGPVTAQKIVDWRTAHGPFRSVDDLDQVPGIGPARIEQLRDLVTP